MGYEHAEGGFYRPRRPKETPFYQLVEDFLRCPFSQARMIELTAEGKALYKSGHNRLGRFPEAAGEDLLAGPNRNFQIFDPLDFLAEVTQHVPDPGDHSIQYYGWHSNKSRGLRAKGQANAARAQPEEEPQRAGSAETLGGTDQTSL